MLQFRWRKPKLREETYKDRFSVLNYEVLVVESQDGATSGVKVCGMSANPARNSREWCHEMNVPEIKEKA